MKVLAFDFGASNGRAILANYENGKLTLEELHRFSNDPVMIHGVFRWDVLRLYHEIIQGITKCVNAGHGDIESIGIDTWGVDFGFLDAKGNLLENPIHYRHWDDKGMRLAFDAAGKEEIYRRTGIQFMPFNTLFQFCTLQKERPEVFDRADSFLFMPDLLAYFLTGEKGAEYTIASTSQMLDVEKRDWDYELLEKVGFPTRILPAITAPGTCRGTVLPAIAKELGLREGVRVIASASHDTASAVASVPKKEEDCCFISCGTWSILGTELPQPLVNDATFAQNFTNEGGVEGTIRFMRNICGLWILQETRRQWIREGCDISFKDIDKMLETEVSAGVYIDPDYEPFGTPGNMPEKIRDYLRKTGQNADLTKGQIAICILESLALTYRRYIEVLEKLMGYTTKTVHLIGGGVKDQNLCRFTAEATGKHVTAGPVEATALGNIAIQLIAGGAVSDIATFRAMMDDIKYYEPQNPALWEEKYRQYLKITGKNCE